MVLPIPVPVEDEWTDLPPVAHAPVSDPYPSNIHILCARSCLLNQLVWLLPCHFQSLIICDGSSLKRDSYRRDGTRERCTHYSHRVLNEVDTSPSSTQPMVRPS